MSLKANELSTLKSVAKVSLSMPAAGLKAALRAGEIKEVKQYTPAQIKKIRTRSNANQPVFAKCLNTSASTVRQWESGIKKPSGIARKMLSLVDSKGLGILLEA